MTRLQVGPIPTDGAYAWIANALELLDGLERCRRRLPFALAEDTVESMRAHLLALRQKVDDGDREIEWQCEADGPELRTLLTYWVNIGSLSDDTLHAAGVGWGPKEGEEFHSRLLRSVIDGLSPIDASYAARLERAWSAPTLDVAEEQLASRRR